MKPESGLFYYTDGYDSIEIELFPGNTLCVINTTYDIAMFETACGTYNWRGDTLVFDADINKFLEKHLQIDTLGCKTGEVLLHSKTITPLKQPEWRNFIKPNGTFSAKKGDSLRLISAVALPEMQYKLSWTEIADFDTLNLVMRGEIEGPSIPIPDASCMNVEYPVLMLGAQNNFYGYKQFVFSRISKNRAQITINNNTFSRQFEYILRDPFGQ